MLEITPVTESKNVMAYDMPMGRQIEFSIFFFINNEPIWTKKTFKGMKMDSGKIVINDDDTTISMDDGSYTYTPMDLYDRAKTLSEKTSFYLGHSV